MAFVLLFLEVNQMKALTARRQAIKMMMAPIYTQIKERSDAGKFCLMIVDLPLMAKHILEELGYSVELGSSGCCYYIEWHNMN